MSLSIYVKIKCTLLHGLVRYLKYLLKYTTTEVLRTFLRLLIVYFVETFVSNKEIRKSIEKRPYQFFNFIVTQIQSFQFWQFGQRLRQRDYQVLAKLQRGQILQAEIGKVSVKMVCTVTIRSLKRFFPIFK